MEITSVDWNLLSKHAWDSREKAYVIGNTAVGAALMTEDGSIFTGCNVEHRYRIQDVHAEVNAITNMINGGYKTFVAIVIAAERKRFTPCGSCLDWIIQFAGTRCYVGYHANKSADVIIHTAHELMPYYPE